MKNQAFIEEIQQAELGKMNTGISKISAETETVNTETAKLTGDMDARLAEMRRMNEDAAAAQAEAALFYKKSGWCPFAVGSGATLVIFVIAELFL